MNFANVGGDVLQLSKLIECPLLLLCAFARGDITIGFEN